MTAYRQDDQEADLRELYPAHYTCFHCIAASCDFSCCREWKIYADDAVFRKWQKMGIRKITRRVNGQRVVRLTEDLDCPHLAEDGLCRIITEYGEGLIPGTCRAFPREVREYPDRRERSLMLACPAVIDLLAEGFSVPGNESPEATGRLREHWMRIIRESAAPEEAFLRLFRVPEDYLTRGSNTETRNHVNLIYKDKKGNEKVKQVTVKVFDVQDGMASIYSSELKRGDHIEKLDEALTYSLDKTAVCYGVYSVNSGYAIFSYVDIAERNEDYCIVNEESSEIRLYDRIVLNSNTISENEIIY